MAINWMLHEYGYPPLPLATVVGHVGKGAENLVARCLEEYGHRLEGDPGSGGPPSLRVPVGPHPGTVAEALALFERHYTDHLTDETRVYPGVANLIQELAGEGRRMAVVSNKPERFSRDILRHLQLDSCFVTVVGGETLPTRKPSPEPLLHAIAVCRSRESTSSAAKAAMIGDTWIDAVAARAAGVPVILVGWGLGDRKTAREAGPDAWVESTEALRALLVPRAAN